MVPLVIEKEITEKAKGHPAPNIKISQRRPLLQHFSSCVWIIRPYNKSKENEYLHDNEKFLVRSAFP